MEHDKSIIKGLSLKVNTTQRGLSLKVGTMPNISLQADKPIVGSSGTKTFYTGEYEITPDKDSQLLDTKNKVMEDNVTVMGIPFYEVMNASGGTTIIIGE